MLPKLNKGLTGRCHVSHFLLALNIYAHIANDMHCKKMINVMCAFPEVNLFSLNLIYCADLILYMRID